MISYFWDIETSTILPDGCIYNEEVDERLQVTYLSNVLGMEMETGKYVSNEFFRTIDETVQYFKTLPECIVWSHNLDYELSFLLRDIGETNGICKVQKGNEVIGIYNEKVQDIILRDKHSPLQIKLSVLPNITFRDTYAIFNKSIKRMGEELNIPKLEYDYEVTRLPWDELEEHDYNYNKRDNEIASKYLFKYMKDNKLSLDEVPLTFTSFVKRKRKDFILQNYGKKGLMKFYFDRNCQCKNFNFFELMMKVYQGGLTASNIEQTGKLIKKGVHSIDIKSSYPYQMCSRFFPFYEEKYTSHYSGELADKYYKIGCYKGFFGTFKFKNIRVKNRNYLLPISSSQLNKGYVSSDKVTFNGKLLCASEIVIPCNDVDIEVIKMIYNFDEIECMDIFSTTKSRRLREEEISFILNGFKNKETITDKDDIEYHLSKVIINAMYGIKVTCPIRSSYSIVDGEIEETDYFSFNINERETIYYNNLGNVNKFSGSTDIFTDGCYITSYARYMLCDMMKTLVDLGCNVVYSDTDSIKFFCDGIDINNVLKFINERNEKIIKDNMNNIRFKNFKKKFNVSDYDFYKICRLGIWELETVNENNELEEIPLFMTYGAKKYGYVKKNGKVVTTIAGCNKKNPPIVIKNLAKKEGLSVEEAFSFIFSLGTQFDETASGRTTAKSEKRSREEMEFLTYKGVPIKQYGGIIIDKTTYTLNVSLNDSLLLPIDRKENVVIKVNIEGDVNFE